jgi:hypothetical protein
MFIQIHNVSTFFMPKAASILSIEISAPNCNGNLSRSRVFGLKKNPSTDCKFTLGLQLHSQGEEPAEDSKIQGLTLDLDVLALNSGQSAFHTCNFLDYRFVEVFIKIPPFSSSNHKWDRQFPYVVSHSLYNNTSMMNYYYC